MNSRILTLVFTDLVGSTALKRQLGDQAVGELIARHRALVGRLATEWSGRIIFAGKGERGIALVRRAVALDPHVPTGVYDAIAAYQFQRQEYAEALIAVQKSRVPGSRLSEMVVSAPICHSRERKNPCLARPPGSPLSRVGRSKGVYRQSRSRG